MAASSRGGWNHNTHYHGLLLAAVPTPCETALDVGCGQGEFARLLAARAAKVEALDKSADLIDRARLAAPEMGNIEFIAADFMEHPLGESTYDFISALATLHHLPFVEAIAKMRALLRPGGTLAVLGLHRPASLGDYLLSAVAAPTNLVFRGVRGCVEVAAPTRPPTMTLKEIGEAAADLLPGAVLRRHLLWRHSLIWTKPGPR